MHTEGYELGTKRDPFGRMRTTRWDLVVAAGKGETEESREALEELCARYWVPLYTYVRCRGSNEEDARDLIQGFFAKLLEKEYLRRVEPDRGSFRGFMLTALRHYVANEWDRVRAAKRGGGSIHLSLDFDSAEGSFRFEPADPSTPERVFERQWAKALLKQVLRQLGEKYDRAGKGELFHHLAPCITRDEECKPYKELAADLSISENAVKVSVHRMRKQFGEFLLEEVQQTVSGDSDVEGEIRHLFAVIV